jgi:hypothetical protein
MTADRCPRSFEAEAMRDGRLGDAERANFERHTKTCPVCTREVQKLEWLAEKLRMAASGRGDELRSRRERTRLLAAFDREIVTPKVSGGGVRRRLLGSVAALAVTVAVLLIWRVHPWKERSAYLEAKSPAVVHADPAAAWSERVDGDREVVTLEHGALSIRVDHARSARKLVVVLPDGELEDTGTTFTVSADIGRTTRVAVQDGSVVLRLRGQPSVALGAGDVWVPAAPPAMAAAFESSRPSGEPASITPSHLPPAESGTQPPRVPTSSEVARDASADFGRPMAALDRGDNRAAAEGFARFLLSHSGDARAEDAAYLRVIALQRCGDHDGERAAAVEYLHRFPAGFRHAEVETLSR